MSHSPFIITRHLKAPRQLVWDMYSQEKHLPHWCGPKGSSMPYCKLDFRVGGSLHYCMTVESGTLHTIQWDAYEASANEEDTFFAGHSSMTQGWSGNLDVLEDYLSILQTP